ncbi:DNA-directed RNA polymerase subunit [Melia azedarach]|uniref:DNA-directed RNA polymerase subunit n=1 Tax=Melia azedarach TaxID=155640 RepID=A0ACC1WT59_MELAZ|nr:DNA-directed RNA polymerase subunit [Melia azedarach]
MADPLGRDFLFCKFCGAMMCSESNYIVCPLCKFKRNIEEVADRKISYTITAEDIRRELGISLFDQIKADKGDDKLQLSKVKRTCEKCQNLEMYYTTRQTRSADEGQTTYYTCPRCGHKCTES